MRIPPWILATLLLSAIGEWASLQRPNQAVAQHSRQTPPATDPRSGPSDIFALDNCVIPADEILQGGPSKDGIPALTHPKFVSVKSVDYLQSQDRVVGMVHSDITRAYPVKILNYHEVVNDRLGRLAVAITYCPLCDSVGAFDRQTSLGELEFGVSGLLYDSNVLFYDRGGQREGLWSQLWAQGISGPGARVQLHTLPVQLTTWTDWHIRHPQTEVLSNETGHQINYQRNPYNKYYQQGKLMFPVSPRSERLGLMTRVLGIWTRQAARAYPIPDVTPPQPTTPRTHKEVLDGRHFTLIHRPKAASLQVAQADPGLSWMYSFWFAWYAFHPHTEITDRSTSKKSTFDPSLTLSVYNFRLRPDNNHTTCSLSAKLAHSCPIPQTLY